MRMSYYKQHVFFCTNQREDGTACCQDHNAQELREYFKQKAKAAKLTRPGGIRINKAGCMGRCAQGPVMVIYPEGIWYRYESEEDLDEILEQHLLNGQAVERLRI